MTTTAMPDKIHHGRNIKRFREMLRMKQETLAEGLGEDWTQKKVSHLEAKETIDPELLEQVAKVLNVPVEAIKNFDEDKAINIISNNTFENCDQAAWQYATLNDCIFNPVDKWLEALEENKKLYERLLESERQKVEILQSQLAAKQ